MVARRHATQKRARRGRKLPPNSPQPLSTSHFQAYARELAVSVAATPALAAALAATTAAAPGPAAVATAYAAAWDDTHGGHSDAAQAAGSMAAATSTATAPPQWALVFTHACTNLGCREPGCALCAHNPRRACVGALAPKCLAGDSLRAACGAPPSLEGVWVGGGESGGPEASQPPLPTGVAVEVCVLDGRQYAALLDAGRGGCAAAAASCILRANNAGSALLVRSARGAGGGAAAAAPEPSPAGGVLLDLGGASHPTSPPSSLSASLADLAVTGSSESLLSGQRPPFRLLARALDAVTRTPLPGWAFAVSDPFVAATPRVRTAIKADIPSVGDHVSKLNAVGPQTQAKLAAIGAEAAAAGVRLALPATSITTVGQFRDLAALAAADPAMTDALKRLLKLTKGWEAACDHAFAAVERDAFARVWYEGGPASDGLVWRADGGAVDLAAPLGLLWRPVAAGSASSAGGACVTPLARIPPSRSTDVARMAARAAACWAAPGHPGWAVWTGVDSCALEAAGAAAGGDVTVEAPGGASAAATHHPRSAASVALGGPTLSALPRPSLLATGGSSWGGGRADHTAAPPAAGGAAPPLQPRFVPPSPFAVVDGIHAPAPSGAAAAAAVAMKGGGDGGGAPACARPGGPPLPLPINAAALRTHLSAVAGRALSGLDMARLIPSFPAVTPSDELFAATGLAPLEFSGSELARLGGGGGGASRAGSGGADDAALLRFLNDRLGLAPGSGLAGGGGRSALPAGGGRPGTGPGSALPSNAGRLRPAPASRGLTGLPSLGGASLSDLPTLPSALFVGLGSMPPPPPAAGGGGAAVAPPPPVEEEGGDGGVPAAAAAPPAKRRKVTPTAPAAAKAPGLTGARRSSRRAAS